jgi:hypothetical protein
MIMQVASNKVELADVLWIRNLTLLTENEVARSWNRLFVNGLSQEACQGAEKLLDELRPESPLRHRLEGELEELRELLAARVEA